MDLGRHGMKKCQEENETRVARGEVLGISGDGFLNFEPR